MIFTTCRTKIMTNQVVLDELLEKVIKMSDEEVERFISEL